MRTSALYRMPKADRKNECSPGQLASSLPSTFSTTLIKR